jgi:hypothetical protein
MEYVEKKFYKNIKEWLFDEFQYISKRNFTNYIRGENDNVFRYINWRNYCLDKIRRNFVSRYDAKLFLKKINLTEITDYTEMVEYLVFEYHYEWKNVSKAEYVLENVVSVIFTHYEQELYQMCMNNYNNALSE